MAPSQPSQHTTLEHEEEGKTNYDFDLELDHGEESPRDKKVGPTKPSVLPTLKTLTVIKDLNDYSDIKGTS